MKRRKKDLMKELEEAREAQFLQKAADLSLQKAYVDLTTCVPANTTTTNTTNTVMTFPRVSPPVRPRRVVRTPSSRDAPTLIDPNELGVLRGIAAAAARALRKNGSDDWAKLEALVKELESLEGNEAAVKRSIEGLMGIAEELEEAGVEPSAEPAIPVSKVETHVSGYDLRSLSFTGGINHSTWTSWTTT